MLPKVYNLSTNIGYVMVCSNAPERDRIRHMVGCQHDFYPPYEGANVPSIEHRLVVEWGSGKENASFGRKGGVNWRIKHRQTIF